MRVFWNPNFGEITRESVLLQRPGASVFDHDRGVELKRVLWADDVTGEYAELASNDDGTIKFEYLDGTPFVPGTFKQAGPDGSFVNREIRPVVVTRRGRVTFTFPPGQEATRTSPD